MISAWWLLLLLPAFLFGFMCGWTMPHIAAAIRLGKCITDAFVEAVDMVYGDARDICEDFKETEGN